MTDHSSNDPKLEDDVIATLKRASQHGAWVDAAWIGLEAGFDKGDSGRKVRPLLKELARRGLIEEQREVNQPIIYRWKAWKAETQRYKGYVNE